MIPNVWNHQPAIYVWLQKGIYSVQGVFFPLPSDACGLWTRLTTYLPYNTS